MMHGFLSNLQLITETVAYKSKPENTILHYIMNPHEVFENSGVLDLSEKCSEMKHLIHC